ncbi:sulfite reductase [Hyphomicrobium methylovorum]|uniref:NADPH-dependent assimilatory sulfite reductase hemoprotein subunit n=1 Tax=Hyphomicrobium methylovorum TaxID=84 RepID=UPI0015E74AC1|nr:NADPH-dependent assimilatory sulfite reductase hemoprotein subunit [Hyphomicrobium methylovorum]MBA2127731.1 sulfite reductase [Hyphomicrobium methylovorum]
MTDKPSKNEFLKEQSNFLRGTIAEGLSVVESGAIAEEDNQLIKFHGSYMQDDRDVRGERSKKKLEKAFSFMIRLRIPGGLVTAPQWCKLDDIATTYANHTLRITTRATFQFHGVIKSNLKRTMQAIYDCEFDTIAACGDVTRGVMSVANPYLSKIHREAYEIAKRTSLHMLPKTSAYTEIWLNGKPIPGKEVTSPEKETIYGSTYLPRKFKFVFAVPPDNDVDVFAHDCGFIAIVENGELVGWNVTIGGGMGMTHGELETFPRLGDVLGFCTHEQAIDVAEKIVTVQRDWGNRSNRKLARLKYTVEAHGLDAFRAEVNKRLGYDLGEARPYKFERNGDRMGWVQSEDKKWHLTLYIESGRVKDTPEMQLRTAIRKIADLNVCDFVMTANQNLIFANVSARAKPKIDRILADHNVSIETSSGARRNSIACVALPTCALALAESERYLPTMLTKLEGILAKAGLTEKEIVVRMTGCPNGCGRPYLGEIGFVGRSPGLYNLYLGAAFDGSRMNKLYAQDVDEARALALLEPIILRYGKEREAGEHFGDFAIRAGYVKPTLISNQFHADVTLA